MTAIHKKPVAPFPDAQGTPSTSAPLTAASAIVAFIDEANTSDKNGETRADNDAAHKQEATAAATPALKTPTRGRPRMHGTGRQANRALRTPVTYAHKLAVIDYYETHERDINATVRKFYAHMTPAAVSSRKRQIYKWVKERAAIEAMCFKSSTAGHSRRRDKGTGTTLGTQGEQDLVLWIQAMQRAGPDAGVGTVSSQSVRAKAMEIAAQHGVPTGSFQATWSWQQGFVKRHQDAIQRF